MGVIVDKDRYHSELDVVQSRIALLKNKEDGTGFQVSILGR
jgi:hypothetical protein